MCNTNYSAKEKIIRHLQAITRNKIVLSRNLIAGIEYSNIGKILSEILYDYSNERRVAMKANEELNKILTSSLKDYPDYGQVIAIKNIGILFEPMLKLNIADIFSHHSQNNLLIVEWEGEITDGGIYFLTQKDGVKTNINHLNPIVIED